MAGLGCLWMVAPGVESFLLATAPACDGDMPDSSIDLVCWTMLCRREDVTIGVLGAVAGKYGFLFCHGLSTVRRLTLAAIDSSVTGDIELASPRRASRLSTIALSCCLMDTSYGGPEGCIGLGIGFDVAGVAEGRGLRGLRKASCVSPGPS